MHTIINALRPTSRTRPAETSSSDAFRQPNYDCRDHPDAVSLVVYVPGVEAPGVEIETLGSDLVVTARKVHFVRINWQSLHLERAQRDYQLRLRLGAGYDYAAMQAEIRHGVLTLTLPKRRPNAAGATARLRHVAGSEFRPRRIAGARAKQILAQASLPPPRPGNRNKEKRPGAGLPQA